MAKKAASRKTSKRTKQGPVAILRPINPEGFLGLGVVDKLTGFKGGVDSIVYTLSGCVQAHVQPPIDKEGKLPTGWFIDLDRLDPVVKGPMSPVAPDDTSHIPLGVSAVDRVTTVEGTLTEKQVHINGCTTYVLVFKGEKSKGDRAIALDWKRLDMKRSEIIVPLPQPASSAPTRGGAMRQSLV